MGSVRAVAVDNGAVMLMMGGAAAVAVLVAAVVARLALSVWRRWVEEDSGNGRSGGAHNVQDPGLLVKRLMRDHHAHGGYEHLAPHRLCPSCRLRPSPPALASGAVSMPKLFHPAASPLDRPRAGVRPAAHPLQNTVFASSQPCRAAAANVPRWPRLGAAHSPTAANASAADATADAECDVVVVGGGHAGCEAATAAARSGARTILLTQRLDTIGELSCNPSIGGIGKGHLVREIDALDGIIGRVADHAGIHFRLLNRSKGPAVRGLRAQADRDRYKEGMQELLRSYHHLDMIEDTADDIDLDTTADPPVLTAVVTSSGRRIRCRAVVITTGTFLRGRCHVGKNNYPAGRHFRNSDQVERPSIGLADTFMKLGFPLGRLKTGTPPRLDGRTIDWSMLEPQESETNAEPFSFLNVCRDIQTNPTNNTPTHTESYIITSEPLDSDGGDGHGDDNADEDGEPDQARLGWGRADGRQVTCHKTYTNHDTHELVMQHQDDLPDYDGGDGGGVGPRYCPSLFKKVQRFPDRERHLIWLEPEGVDSHIVYPNGLSGPFPPEIQQRVVRTMPGLENTVVLQPGYDVEYDFVDSRALTHTLETRAVRGLFLAGQICGTTGYEEAAALGLMAGANAARVALGQNPFVLGRDQAYIGVLVDDLVTKGTEEPYRMFTSRAEYRLALRSDDADLRLTELGHEHGLVKSPSRIAALRHRKSEVDKSLLRLVSFSMPVFRWQQCGIEFPAGGRSNNTNLKTGVDILEMPHVTLATIEQIMVSEGHVDPDDISQAQHLNVLPGMLTPQECVSTVEAEALYGSYVNKQKKEVQSYQRNVQMRIPADMTYTSEELPALSSEELEKLRLHRPATLHAASQIQGLTPAGMVYLYNHVTTRRDRRVDQKLHTGQEVTQ